MQTANLSDFPAHIQQVLPELLQLDYAQRLSLIDLLSTDSDKKKELQQAIQKGLNSPLVEDFDWQEHLSELKNSVSVNG